MNLIIEIHDDDRAECPDKPWAACYRTSGTNGPESFEAGLGATPREALDDLLTRDPDLRHFLQRGGAA